MVFQTVVLFCPVFASSSTQQSVIIQERMDNLSNFLKINKLVGMEVNKESLPKPYNFLLVQPLMTIGIEQYYQRTPEIKTIYAEQDHKSNCYSRVIYMFMNKEKVKYRKGGIQSKSNNINVELAFITINFNELSEQVIRSILENKTPFGKILVNNKIKTFTKDRAYFSVKCTSDLAKILHCKINKNIYGRINTLVREDNKNWVAQVIEILSGVTCSDTQCTVLLLP